MSHIKKLAGQAAIYGLSSILGRLLNVLLVPLYTRVFDVAEYGVVTQLYAYVGFLNVIFTYGLETAFFRFIQSEKSTKVYSTSVLSIVGSSLIFILPIIIFSGSISDSILKGAHYGPTFIMLFAGILALEAISTIPFAKLRSENKAKKFAMLRLVNIGINFSFNLFFLVLCPVLIKNGYTWVSSIYNPAFGVGYVFLSNFIASAFTLLMLAPEFIKVHFDFDNELWKKMMIYAFPLMIAGLAGMVNELIDRILIPFLIHDKNEALIQLGIYGACYKLSIIMTLFIQTFNYAAQPFFFNHSTKENPQIVYAQVMKWFVIVCSFIFLSVMLFIDIAKYFIGPDFRSGLKVVPVLLLANMCLGVTYNLAIWYKLTSKTRWGAWLSVIGALITLGLNFLLIPVMGYMGAAWTTLICYGSIMILSYLIGQKMYPVSYDVKSFFLYLILALGLWFFSMLVRVEFNLSENQSLGFNVLVALAFLICMFLFERRKFTYLRRQ